MNLFLLQLVFPDFTDVNLTLKSHLHWQCFYCDIAGDSDMWQSLLTRLGNRKRCDRDRIISIYVALPKVTKASNSVLLSPVIFAGIILPPLPM